MPSNSARTSKASVNILKYVRMGTSSNFGNMLSMALAKGFGTDAAQFQTGWFLESIATQILVIFLIRSRGALWKSRPHWILVATSLGALAGTILLVTSPLRSLFGFVPLGAALGWSIVAIVIGYLICAEAVKRFAIPASARQQ